MTTAPRPIAPPELEPPPTEPAKIDPNAVLGVCRYCGVDVTALTLAAAFAEDEYVCRKCDGPVGEPD